MFADRLESFGGNVAISLPDGSYVSYVQLAGMADTMYESLPPGTLVAIESASTLDTLVAYLGALRRRCPAILLDADLPLDTRKSLYNRYGIGAVFGASGWMTGVSSAHAAHPDLALLLSTSGSTGSPKLVRLSVRNLQSNAAAIAQYLALDESDRPVTVLPVHYSYGLSVVNSHLLVGATLLLTSEPVTSKAFWETVREGHATSLSGVPAHYAMLRRLRFERMALPDLRTLTQAGGRMTPDMVRWCAELAVQRGWRFFVMYGQTEAAPRMAYLPPEEALKRPDSIGIPIPGGRIELVDAEGAVQALGAGYGEIIYYGDNVMLGYASQAEDLLLGDVMGGRLATGDIARRDNDGFLYVEGRRSRFIKVAGNRIGLDDVESQLTACGYQVAVTGVDDLLMVAYQGLLDEAALLDTLFARYRLHRTRVKLKQVAEFPVSTSGKVLYEQLKELFA